MTVLEEIYEHIKQLQELREKKEAYKTMVKETKEILGVKN